MYLLLNVIRRFANHKICDAIFTCRRSPISRGAYGVATMKGIVFITVLLLASIQQVGCTFFPCNDDIKSESRSPDGKYVAALYERNCGATTNFSTIVNIRNSSSKFNRDEDIVLVVKGRHQISLVWKDSRTMQIVCANCPPDDIFKRERSWKDIQIIY